MQRLPSLSSRRRGGWPGGAGVGGGGGALRAGAADFRLGGTLNGLELLDAIKAVHAPPPSCALVTADFDPAVIEAARARLVPVFAKPLSPQHLRALLGL